KKTNSKLTDYQSIVKKSTHRQQLFDINNSTSSFAIALYVVHAGWCTF
ncbi:MAG: hypothetical protein ACI90V_010307, partial [Bacillariaceae sp.]